MISNLAQDVQVFTSNAFLVVGDDEAAGRRVLVDPGNEFDIVSRVEEQVEGLDAVVLTHTHPDHVGNVDAVVDAFDVDVWGFDPDSALVDHGIDDGESVTLGDHDYQALHTPGHKNDHLCFHSTDAGVLFAGDLVFANGGFGRTDLEEGNRGALIESIDYVLDTVGDDLRELHTGHGPSAFERARDHIELAAQAAQRY